VRILGIDPGLQITGYGILDFSQTQPRLIDGGVIRLNTKSSLPDRLVELHTELETLLDESKPQICAVEQLYAHYNHPRTAIIMAHARGIILLAARRRNIQLKELPANRIKQSVAGHGHAQKAQMQRAVQQILRLKTLPTPPDVADALAAALCCGWNLRGKSEPTARSR
jgi:crossover junction endodeoxyribonuclease RuvC